jgi:hypothetical protein
MSEGIFTIELGSHGFMLDTDWAYVSLSWELLISTAVIIVGAKVYNKIKNSKKETPLLVDDNDDWMTK